MPGIEPVPGVVVLAGVLRALDPFHAADCHDVRAVGQERCRLPGRRPVEVHQQPGWRNALEVRDQPVHQLAGVRRVRDDRVGRAVMVERKRILAGADVAGIDAAQAERFQMPDQRAVASTGLGKGADRREGTESAAPPLPVASGRNRLAALEVGSLAHRGVRFCYPVAPCLTAPVLPAVCNPPYASRSFRRLSLPLAGATREIVLNDNCPSASRNRHDKAASAIIASTSWCG